MAYRLKKTIVLVGMMGAGKTAIGTELARVLDVPFLDSDAEIVAAANQSIAEIFEDYGEHFFREKEHQVISRLLDQETGILSTGGGAYLADENRQMMSEKGAAVWLKADLPLLWARVRHKDTRPLLRTGDPLATLSRIFDERQPHYAKADLVVEAKPSYSISDMTARVIDALLTRPDLLEEV